MATSTEGFTLRLPEKRPEYGLYDGAADLYYRPGGRPLTFYYDPASPDLPALPVRHVYEYEPEMYWMVDAADDCWMTEGHYYLKRVTRDELLRWAKMVGGYYKLRELFGLLPAMPSWEWGALCAGWTPPAGWDPGSYDPTTIPDPKSPLISKYLNQKG